MIKVNSILGIVFIMSFMSQDSEFFRKKVQFLPVYVSHSYQKGVSFVGMRHFFGYFSIKFLLFFGVFTKNGSAQFEHPTCHGEIVYPRTISPELIFKEI